MTIRPALASEFEALANLWEASVRASHDFLTEQDIRELRPQLLQQWLPSVALVVWAAQDAEILGFAGVAAGKLEMLFVAPTAFQRGIGKQLVAHAIAHMAVKLVDVNEQNPEAVGFYERMGFEVFARSERDGQGKAYPLLHMRLSDTTLTRAP